MLKIEDFIDYKPELTIASHISSREDINKKLIMRVDTIKNNIEYKIYNKRKFLKKFDNLIEAIKSFNEL